MIEDNFDPKKSIREYVNEDELRFEMLMIKLSSQLHDINHKKTEDIVEEFEKYKEKRILYYENELKKINTQVGIDAFAYNVGYMENLQPPLNIKNIELEYKQAKKEYITLLTTKLRETKNTKEQKNLTSDIEYVNGLTLTERHSKEHFGKMIMLIIKNLAVKPCFSSYTDNWKDEFFSNAIEKILLYSRNFDVNLLSKRTGQKSKAFAYITQIAFNAFVAIINKRKIDEGKLKESIQYEKMDSYKQFDMVNESTYENNKEYTYKLDYVLPDIPNDNDLYEFIEFQLEYIIKQNNIKEQNDVYKTEIDITTKNTSAVDKRTTDYIKYIRELEDKIQPQEFLQRITALEITHPVDYKIPSSLIEPILDLSNSEKYKNISVILKHIEEVPSYKSNKTIVNDECILDYDTEFDDEEW